MAQDPFSYADELGPEKILHIHEASTGLKAIVVIDNLACGPSIGSVRMAPDVNLDECIRLARAITLKSAAAGLPHGGGKSVIYADPKMPEAEKERLIRAFACAIRNERGFIPGPDMGTNETAMAWIHDEIGRSAGLPHEIGGIPLDEIGATGLGVTVATQVALEHCGRGIDGSRVAVQGFGSVGKHAARFLTDRGAVLVAASDSSGTVADPTGLDVEALIEHKASGLPFSGGGIGSCLPRDAIIDVECDIWIPAARPDVIRAETVERLRTRLIVQAANIPATEGAEIRLHDKGILAVPDFIANAGGLICAAVEYVGGSQAMAFQAIEEKIRDNTKEVLARSTASGTAPRRNALAMARERVLAAMRYRRWS